MATRETTVKLSVADNFSTQLRAFARALDQSGEATKKLSTSQQALKTAGQGATDMLMGLGVAVPTSPMLAFGQAMKYSIDRAMESEVIMAKTSAVIKSTGGAAGYTADQISQMAGELSSMSAVDDETVQSAENVMLTFTSIGKETFPQAMEAALNMSAALGQDLQSSVIQVGKALQDPINGMTALRRVGVNFNDTAKETVKQLIAVGDTAGAQAFILKELKTEFGGAAEAMGDTTQGKIKKLQIAVDNLAESFGKKLIPVLSEAADAALTLASWNDKLTAAFDGTEKKLVDSTQEYADYKSAVEATGRAAGLVNDAFIIGQGTVTKYSDKFHILTQSQYNAARGAYGLNGALDETNRAARGASAAVNDNTEALDAMTRTESLLKEGTQELTNQFVYQKAAQNMDAEAALDLGLRMGVLNDQTVSVAKQLDSLRDKYDRNKDGAISAAEAAAGYADDVKRLGDEISRLHDKTVNINVITHEQRITEPVGRTSPLPGGAAQGADFIVPSGYPNDTYPLRVSSGERVVVLTKQDQQSMSNGAHDTSVNDNRKVAINIYPQAGMDINALADAISRKLGGNSNARQRMAI